MKQSRWALLLWIVGACVSTAGAQPAPRRGADAGGPRDPRFVVQRGAGTWQPNCTASLGCARPAEVPRCGQGAAPTALNTLWAQRFDRRGQAVRVRGSLSTFKACTEVACNPTTACCNHCTGTVSFVGGASAGLAAPPSFTLDLPPAQTFSCTGDDSGLCCNLAVPTGAVVAEGTLQPIEGSGGAWRIAGARLCAE